MAHPLINRTSPKGAEFRGICAACGKRDLPINTKEECENHRDMTREEAIIEAIEFSACDLRLHMLEG